MTTTDGTRRSGIPIDRVVVARLLQGVRVVEATDDEIDAALAQAAEQGVPSWLIGKAAGVSGSAMRDRLSRRSATA